MVLKFRTPAINSMSATYYIEFPVAEHLGTYIFFTQYVLTEINGTDQYNRGRWLGCVKVSGIFLHRGVQMMLA